MDGTIPEEPPKFQTIPKLLEHCIALYDLMEKEARDTSDGKVFIGSLSTLIASLGLSQSAHSRVVGRMKAMGSIAMLKRGGGNTKSVWGLYGSPTTDDFFNTDMTGDSQYDRKAQAYDHAMQRISDLSKRVQKIEDLLRERGMNL